MPKVAMKRGPLSGDANFALSWLNAYRWPSPVGAIPAGPAFNSVRCEPTMLRVERLPRVFGSASRTACVASPYYDQRFLFALSWLNAYRWPSPVGAIPAGPALNSVRCEPTMLRVERLSRVFGSASTTACVASPIFARCSCMRIDDHRPLALFRRDLPSNSVRECCESSVCRAFSTALPQERA